MMRRNDWVLASLDAALLICVFLLGASIMANGPREAAAQAPAPPNQLTVMPSDGKFVGVVSSSVKGKWIVFSQDFLPVAVQVAADGESVVFEAAAGRYAVLFLPPGEAQPIVSPVVLGGESPKPNPPGPEPEPSPPGPAPNVPDDPFGVGKLTYELAAKFASANRARAAKVAANYDEAARRLDIGQLGTITQASDWVKAENGKVIKDGVPQAEQDEWLLWGSKIGQLWNDHWPLDRGQVAVFYRGIASGLKAVR